VERDFEPHVRVLVRVRGEEREGRGLRVSVHGKANESRRRIHPLSGGELQWWENFGTLTSGMTFSQIKKIAIQGLSQASKSEVRIADYSRPDHTGLLPLWAGVPAKDRAEQLVKHSVTNGKRYWREFGLPSWPADGLAYRYAPVEIRPNLMIGEGLVDHGYLEIAASLVERLMRACIHTLHQDRDFRETYHPDRPGGSGKPGHSSGVAPLSLFLYVLGVRLISARKVALRGRNPFPWPIRLRHRGIEINWDKEGARVHFPDGGTTLVTGQQVQVVELTEL
ncbi:MAG: hypothetical protein ACE5MM_08070, partial [Nitrospiraceae bacterium]